MMFHDVFDIGDRHPLLPLDSAISRFEAAHVLLLDFFGPEDPRVWAALSRLCQLKLLNGDPRTALSEIPKVLSAFDNAVWEKKPFEDDYAVWDRGGEERFFACGVLSRARELISSTRRSRQDDGARHRESGDEGSDEYDGHDDFDAAGGYDDESGLPIIESSFFQVMQRGPGHDMPPYGRGMPEYGLEGQHAPGSGDEPGPFAALRGWEGADPGRSARGKSLRGEMARLESELGPSHPSALRAKASYARHLAGERGAGPGLKDPVVPECDLRDAAELCLQITGCPDCPPEIRFEAVRLHAWALWRQMSLVKDFDDEHEEILDKVTEMRRDILAEAKESLGPGHLTVLCLTSDLADSINCLDHDQGRALYETALKGFDDILGESSRESLVTRMRISFFLPSEHDIIPYMERVRIADALEKNGRADALDAMYVRRDTGDLLVDEDEDAAACAVFGRAAVDAQRLLGKLHPETLLTVEKWAASLQRAGHGDYSCGAFRHIVGERLSPLFPDYPEAGRDFARTYYTYGSVLAREKYPDMSRTAFLRAVTVIDHSESPTSPVAISLVTQAAKSAESAGSLEMALHLFREALDRRRKAGIADDYDSGEIEDSIEWISKKLSPKNP